MDNGNFCAVFSSISRRLLILLTMKILLAKLENHGVGCVINSWFRSAYLTSRKHVESKIRKLIMLCLRPRRPCAVCHKAQSSDHSCSFCTSILFTNPLRYYWYKYYTTIILANNNLKELESLVNHDRELGCVNEWLTANKLSLNIKNQTL